MMSKSKASEAVAEESFVTLLRRHRIARGLTQTALAKKLGVSDSTVSFWESGSKLPSPKLVPRLARLIGVSAMDLTKMLDPEDQSAAAR